MAMKVFTVGQVLAAADVNEYLVNSHFAYKASDTSRTSSPGMANDPDLVLAVEANVIYEMWLEVVYTSLTAAMAVQFTVPSGTTLGGTVMGRSSGSYVPAPLAALTALPFTGDAPAGSTYTITAHGLVNTASATGNLQLQWAQGSSSANATVAKAGSMLSMRRVA